MEIKDLHVAIALSPICGPNTLKLHSTHTLQVVGCNWIELPAGSWSVASSTSRAQMEVDIAWDKMVSHQPEVRHQTQMVQINLSGFLLV